MLALLAILNYATSFGADRARRLMGVAVHWRGRRQPKRLQTQRGVTSNGARLIHTQPALQALSLMWPDLQAVRHFENRRQDAEYNQAYQKRDHHDDDRRNQLRNYPDRPIEFALIDVRDRLHSFGEMPGLFAHGHHVGEQIGKELL